MGKVSALPEKLQLISHTGEFSSDAQSFVEELKPHSSARSSYLVVSIVGPQSSGKSTLLNTVFGTTFKVLESQLGRTQTTKGIWISRCVNPCMILMDVEGSDGKERKDNTLFERQSALFALTVSDVLLLNMWFTDIGRREGAGTRLLELIFQERVLISGVNKTKVIICIRDHNNIQCSPDKTREQVLENINEIWKEVHPPSTSDKKMSDYMEVVVNDFPHRDYEKEQFEQKCNDLVQLLSSIAASDSGQKYYASSFVFSSQKIWTLIIDNKRLNATSYKEAMSSYICDEIADQVIKSIDNAKEYQSLMELEIENEDDSTVLLCNKLLSSLLESLLSKYDAETEFADEDISSKTKKILEHDLYEKLKPTYETNLDKLRAIIVPQLMQRAQELEGNLKDPNEEAHVRYSEDRFEESCADVHRLFLSWYREYFKELESYLRTTMLQALNNHHPSNIGIRVRASNNDTKTALVGQGQAYAYFRLLTEEIFCHSSNANQVLAIRTGKNKRFGDIVVSNWELYDPSQPSKAIGSAQGQQIKVDSRRADWDCSFTMTLRDTDEFKGSSIMVRGLWDEDSPFEWAILGGTGKLTLAEGIIYGKKLRDTQGGRLLELTMHVFYRKIIF